MDGLISYILAKGYVDKTMAGAGAVAGAPCQIKSIIPVAGGNNVIFEWEDNSGVVHTSPPMFVKDGASAYEVWLAQGNIGTELDFIDSLQGIQGPEGKQGESAYDIWLKEGNIGTEVDFLDSLKGNAGDAGASAYETWIDEGNSGSQTDFLDALKGADGNSAYQVWLDSGNTGTEADFIDSLKGTDGTDGDSAYQTWLNDGNTGTEADFIDSLKGTDGESAYQVWLNAGNSGSESDFIDSLQGTNGASAYELWCEANGFSSDPADPNYKTEADFMTSLEGTPPDLTSYYDKDEIDQKIQEEVRDAYYTSPIETTTYEITFGGSTTSLSQSAYDQLMAGNAIATGGNTIMLDPTTPGNIKIVNLGGVSIPYTMVSGTETIPGTTIGEAITDLYAKVNSGGGSSSGGGMDFYDPSDSIPGLDW